jgi:hypothetical protein
MGDVDEQFLSLRPYRVLLCLYLAGIGLNLTKFVDGCHEIKYIGFLVNGEGHRLDPSRLDPILNYPLQSESVVQCPSFNGVLMQFEYNIKDFCIINKPVQATIIPAPFLLTAADTAFLQIKELI